MKKGHVSRFFWVVLGFLLATAGVMRTADGPSRLLPDVKQQGVVNADFWWKAMFEMSHIWSLPWTYSAEAIDAWVFDAETGQPLEGVVVVVSWGLRQGGFHPAGAGWLQVMETVTDAKGHFAFPAWGPKSRPAGMYLFDDPRLYFFKHDYRYAIAGNSWPTMKPNLNSLRCFEKNGLPIQMKKFTGSLEEYAQHLSLLDSLLNPAFEQNCFWKQIPHMLVAMHLEAQRFREKKIHTSLNLIEQREGYNASKYATCGSVREYLRSYLP
jgi:hypothetical protein